MPLYEYRCYKCKHLSEYYYKKFPPPTYILCPYCGGAAKHTISRSNFVLKGPRWAKDGYSK